MKCQFDVWGCQLEGLELGGQLRASNLVLDGFVTEKGIVYETEQTPQQCLKKSTGILQKRSGDGTVPYSSLAWCKEWESEIPGMFRIYELSKAEHREILIHRGLWTHITDIIAKYLI